MSNHEHRGRIELLPIEGAYKTRRWGQWREQIAKVIPMWDPVGLVQDGVLARHRAEGRYAIVTGTANGALTIKQVDQRKARAADEAHDA